MRYAVVGGVFLLVALLAGCAGESAPQVATTTPTTAPAPLVDADTGSLTGLVTDEELVPIARARASIVETQAVQETDAEGRFTFNGLTAGSYRLVVEALGYESLAKKVTIAAGETTNASIVLPGLVVAVDPYHLSIPKVSLIQVSNSFLSIVANYSAICGSCFHTVAFDPVPLQVLVENHWSATEVGPINAEIDLWWRYNDASGGYHNNLDTYGNRESKFVPEAEATELASSKVDRFELAVEGNILSVQHRVETWHTFAYLAPLADGFTALPPP